jgi:1-acyl-sn-glycerol-3-phosphate acyltransferase
MRLIWRAAGILAGLAVCVALHYLWKAVGRRSPWTRRFLGWAGRRSGLVVSVEGIPLRANVLYAANHVSWLDILAMGGAVPAIFVARKDMESWPMIGWAASLNDTIYIARDVRSTVRGQADALREALEDGRAVTLFPEGTTDAGREILPFRASLFASLYPPLPGLMVQPVAIDYGDAFADAAWTGDEAYGLNARRILARPGRLPVTLRFLDPIDPAEARDRKALALQAREAVVTALGASAPAIEPLYPAR